MTQGTLQTQDTPFGNVRLLVFAAAAGAAVLAPHAFISQETWTVLAIASIMVAVWHGAFDGVLAEEALRPAWGPRWRPAFYLLYVAVTAAVVLLWWLVPPMALPLFLVYSAFHFGTEGESHFYLRTVLAGTAFGFLPIAAACRWWPAETTAIFQQMLGGAAGAAHRTTWAAGVALWPLLAVALAAAWKRHGYAPTILVTVILVLFRFSPPIPAFALFFCLWHTPEHMVATSINGASRFEMGRLLRHLRKGTLPWLLALGGISLLFWYGRHTITACLGTLFIALSALTVPHMSLAEVLRRRKASALPQQRTTPRNRGLAVRG